MTYNEVPKIEITPTETTWETENNGSKSILIKASVSGDPQNLVIKKKKYLLIEEGELKKILKRPKVSNPLMAELENFN